MVVASRWLPHGHGGGAAVMVATARGDGATVQARRRRGHGRRMEAVAEPPKTRTSKNVPHTEAIPCADFFAGIGLENRDRPSFATTSPAPPLRYIGAGCAVTQNITRWRPVDTAAKVWMARQVVGEQRGDERAESGRTGLVEKTHLEAARWTRCSRCRRWRDDKPPRSWLELMVWLSCGALVVLRWRRLGTRPPRAAGACSDSCCCGNVSKKSC